MVDNLIVLGLNKLAQLLDRLVPMQGGRTMLVAVLAIVGNLCWFFTGKETANEATNNIVMAFGIVFAAMQDRKSTRLNSSHIQKSRMPSSA